MLRHKQANIWIWGFFGLLAMALVAPIGSETFIRNMADFINHLMTVIQTKSAFEEGQFPLRVALNEMSGWGYPLYQFYSPSAYTFTGLIYQWITPNNPLLAIKLSIWLMLWCGGFYFYRLTDYLLNSRYAAILASVTYLTTPYYIIVVNRFGDLTESMALGLLPAVLYYSIQRFQSPAQTKTLVQASLVWYLLLTSHIVTFIQTSIFIGLWMIIITLKNRQYIKNLLQVGVAYALACLMGMWFFAPLAIMVKLLVATNSFEKASDFVSYNALISYLLFSSAAISKLFISGLQSFHPALGLPILFGVGLAFYAYWKNEFPQDEHVKTWVRPLLILFLLAFIMVWSPFNFWKFLPNFFIVGQYAWRYLGELIWIGSILFAVGLDFLFKKQLRITHLAIGVILIVISTNAWYPQADHNSVSLKEVIKNPHLIYGKESYLINFQKYPETVDAIDSMQIYPLMAGGTLHFDIPYIIPRVLSNLAFEPKISFRGKISTETKDGYQLGLLINDKLASSLSIKPGNFNWDIPLRFIFTNKPAVDKFTLRFVVLKENKQVDYKPMISVSELILGGFLKPASFIPLESMLPLCHRRHAMTLCHVNVASARTLLELPILYYPQLLDIRINGQAVPYQSLLHKNNLMTSIQARAGVNDIQIKFRGLAWANWVSVAAWGLWGLLVLGTLKYVLSSRGAFSATQDLQMKQEHIE